MEILFIIIVLYLGACFGSFLCCQARRLHYKETTKRKRNKKLNRRSVCMNCNYQLKWYDNIPIFSWLFLRGRCRNCHQKIGIAELLSELGTGAAFAVLAISFNHAICSTNPTLFGIFPAIDPTSSFCPVSSFNVINLILAFILTLTLLFLAIYDGLYGELPTVCLIIAIICSLAIVVSRSLTASFFSAPYPISDPILSALILGGIYLLLYLVSKGSWVGDGDWLLGIAISFALGTPWLALIVLFLANLLACLVMCPLIKLSKPTKPTSTKASNHRLATNHAIHKIHLGPFLVSAYLIVFAFYPQLVNLLN